jgi:hypothetical protein
MKTEHFAGSKMVEVTIIWLALQLRSDCIYAALDLLDLLNGKLHSPTIARMQKISLQQLL